MKALLVAALIVISGCCSHTLHHVNHVGLSAMIGSIACDWGQTRSAASDGWSGGRYEANPILGSHPSTGRVDVYFAFSAIALIAVSHALPERVKPVLWVPVLANQAYVIVDNVRTTSTVCGF